MTWQNFAGSLRTPSSRSAQSSIATLKTRPDYAITLHNALVGLIEVKAPCKGADPRKCRDHDKEQSARDTLRPKWSERWSARILQFLLRPLYFRALSTEPPL